MWFFASSAVHQAFFSCSRSLLCLTSPNYIRSCVALGVGDWEVAQYALSTHTCKRIGASPQLPPCDGSGCERHCHAHRTQWMRMRSDRLLLAFSWFPEQFLDCRTNREFALRCDLDVSYLLRAQRMFFSLWTLLLFAKSTSDCTHLGRAHHRLWWCEIYWLWRNFYWLFDTVAQSRLLERRWLLAFVVFFLIVVGGRQRALPLPCHVESWVDKDDEIVDVYRVWMIVDDQAY